MHIRVLKKEDFEKLHYAFVQAFSNNKVQFQPSLEEFEYRLYSKLHIDHDLSAVCYDGNELIGFIVHTTNLYEGMPTAFNGGTGVIPGFRKQNIAEHIYDFLIPIITAQSVGRILLEVIDSNEKAIRLYEKIGFRFRRNFRCYKLKERLSGPLSEEIEEATFDDIYPDFCDFEPSFVDSYEQLVRGDEKVLVCKREGRLAGYVIFQPHLGRISQIAVSRIFRGEGVGSVLIRGAQFYSKKLLTIMNVPYDRSGFDFFLKRCGFENQVNQIEMEFII